MVFGFAPGFHVDTGETLYIYRLFNNLDEKDTDFGDRWITHHYITG